MFPRRRRDRIIIVKKKSACGGSSQRASFRDNREKAEKTGPAVSPFLGEIQLNKGIKRYIGTKRRGARVGNSLIITRIGESGAQRKDVRKTGSAEKSQSGREISPQQQENRASQLRP